MFDSVLFGCANPYAETTVNNITVTSAEQRAVFTAGTNNLENGSGLLSNTYFPAGAALSATPFDASTLNPTGTSFLVKTSYVGAVNGANDTWYRGWTCSSNRAAFATSASCTALPN